MSVTREAAKKAKGRVSCQAGVLGGTLTPLDTMRAGYTLIVTAQQDGPGNGSACKEVNSRVRPTQFINGREQGFPGYPVWKRSDIINHNASRV